MKKMSSNEIRQVWLNFFKSKEHYVISSASLIPSNDKTLLWINAGVAPLKKYFDGSETPPKKRLTNVQKCIRTNDIDNVGHTARHHTFFEMLGNFSIGDYFKNEALEFAYELLFSESYFGFPKNLIYITYYPDDTECYNKWLSLGIDKTHLVPKEDNFWEIGPGPSGPDTEIFFDRGETYDSRGVELLFEDLENDRYIEIWNIVFSQYNALPGKVERKFYKELPSKNIDTGAGLERIACVLQETPTNFETDLFLPIINKIEQLSGFTYDGQMAFKVIADHVKALTMSISDGAVLSNVGRGYVLRRILRRALKYARTLKLNHPFLYTLVDTVVEVMGETYSYLYSKKEMVKEVIRKEEEKFLKTLVSGENLFYEYILSSSHIDGKTAFKLYDTYGYPLELTLELALENNVTVDTEGFKEELAKSKKLSRSGAKTKKGMGNQNSEYLNFTTPSLFIGYDNFSNTTKVLKVFKEGIVLEETCFYATSGGQACDTGYINSQKVSFVSKLPNGQFLHKVKNIKLFKEGETVNCNIDVKKRNSTMRNHSCTHLLQAALREIVGPHIAQQGSYVDDKIFRFDFNNYNILDDTTILKIENLINSYINKASKVTISYMNIKDATSKGATALFNEKYGEIVRVVDMVSSIELCGGTHVNNTLDIIKCAIVSLTSVGSGIYRITGVTGKNLQSKIKPYLNKQYLEIENAIKKVSSNYPLKRPSVSGSYNDIILYHEYVNNLKENYKTLEKTKKEEEAANFLRNIDNIIPKNYNNNITIETLSIDNNILKQALDVIYNKTNAKYIFIVNKNSDNINYFIRSKASDAIAIIKELNLLSNGFGGGKDYLAQGGTKDITKEEVILDYLKGFN